MNVVFASRPVMTARQLIINLHYIMQSVILVKDAILLYLEDEYTFWEK